MRDLTAIGYWRREGCESFPMPQALVSTEYVPSLCEAICRYLDSGAEFMGFLGYSFCRFRCGIPDSQMGCRDLSDGQWVWPEGLSHYVRVHGIRLPEEFVQFMADADWRCAELPRLPGLVPLPDGGSRMPVTHEFWIRWSQSLRAG